MINFKNHLLVWTALLNVMFATVAIHAKSFSSDEVQIFYTDTASTKKPLILLHGFSMSSSMWQDSGIIEKLNSDFRVISMDFRGHGQSSKFELAKDYGPHVAGDVVGLIKHLEIESVIIVGFSMGAHIAAELLVRNPELIQAAVLVSGFFPTDHPQELAFQADLIKDLEKQNDLTLAAVARGWRDVVITDQEIENIKVPFQAVFGELELNDFLREQITRLETATGALDTIVIPNADHDSNKAALLHPRVIDVIKGLSNSEN